MTAGQNYAIQSRFQTIRFTFIWLKGKCSACVYSLWVHLIIKICACPCACPSSVHYSPRFNCFQSLDCLCKYTLYFPSWIYIINFNAFNSERFFLSYAFVKNKQNYCHKQKFNDLESTPYILQKRWISEVVSINLSEIFSYYHSF